MPVERAGGTLAKNGNQHNQDRVANRAESRIMGKNPHDAFFKEFFGSPKTLGQLLEQILPEPLYQQIEPESLRIDPGSCLDEEGRGYFSDLAASAVLAGRRTTVYILVEHKSSPDIWVHLQLHHYMNRLWKKEAAGKLSSPRGGGGADVPGGAEADEKGREDGREERRLSPILPILFYHGRRPGIDPAFHSLFSPDMDPRLVRHQPDFDLVVCNLSTAEESEIGGPPEIQAALYSLKYVRDNLDRLLQLLNRLAERWGLQFVYSPAFQLIELYILAGSRLTDGEMRERIRSEVTDPVLQEVFMSTAQMLWSKGRQEGHQEGLQEGLREGLQEGLQEGRRVRDRQVASRLRDKGMPPGEIADLLGLTVPEVQNLLP